MEWGLWVTGLLPQHLSKGFSFWKPDHCLHMSMQCYYSQFKNLTDLVYHEVAPKLSQIKKQTYKYFLLYIDDKS